jgi:hypothetical protein
VGDGPCHSSSTICTAIEVPESVMPHKPTLAAFCCPSHTNSRRQGHWQLCRFSGIQQVARRTTRQHSVSAPATSLTNRKGCIWGATVFPHGFEQPWMETTQEQELRPGRAARTYTAEYCVNGQAVPGQFGRGDAECLRMPSSLAGSMQITEGRAARQPRWKLPVQRLWDFRF